MAAQMGSASPNDVRYVGAPRRTIALNKDLLDHNDKRIKEDILRLLLSYLQDEGYLAAKMTLQDEANVKISAGRERVTDLKAIRKVIREGDWTEVERLVGKLGLKNNKSFLYAIYKQQYLEHIDSGEYQKAFTYLTKRLKPLEQLQTTPDEFKDLCYLLSCRSVQEAPSFKSWEGVGPSRDKLVEDFQSMLDFEAIESAGPEYVSPDRLITMLRQAVAYQVEFSRYHPRTPPKITTLLEDYSSFVIPNSQHKLFEGHEGNVKCVQFLGYEGAHIASGSSDNTVRVWDTESAACVGVLRGHTSRVWELSANTTANMLASASADGTVKLWDLQKLTSDAVATFDTQSGDLYTVQFHPGKNHVVTGGYDKTLRLFDIRTSMVVKGFTGHKTSVTSAVFNPHGNLVISGSKDQTVKFWDISSGLCVNTLTAHLGEVTSVAVSSNGMYLLTASKDNANRLWDVRMLQTKQRLKGHQNTSKNFIRAGFGHKSLVVGGSEDGQVHVWDMESGHVLQRLDGHSGIVYNAVWNAHQSLLVSCGEDKTLRSWWFDETRQPNDDR